MQHVYHRIFDPDAEDSLAKIARLIPPGSTVLDLGTGPGVLASHLAGQLRCTVDGVEYNAAAAERASPFFRTLKVADLEQSPLSSLFPGSRYDFVICADVLEHLRYPEQVLDQLGRLLKPGGRAIISIPNAAYAGLVLDLAQGHFEYREEGLLDRTHLRFFTRSSFVDLLAGLGYAIEHIEPIRLPFERSEFAKRWNDYPALIKSSLLANPEADAYQYLLVVYPKAPQASPREYQADDSARPCLVDVIITISRGLIETRRCLESVLASPQETPFEILAVNTDSPEAGLADYLSRLAGQGKLRVLETQDYLGFAAAANRAMVLHPERDVVLLDSAIEVHGDWLDRLRRCAYSGADTATVTPFSNNAWICSYPRLAQANPLPDGWSLAALDGQFAKINRAQSVEIPAAVGFCTYLRRRCLNQVGYFDALNFKGDYEAQSDFSLRAREAGLKHLLCGDSFVYHQGNGSYVQESERFSAVQRLLHEHYPHYQETIREHRSADPARVLRRRIDIARLTSSPRDKILLVTHRLSGGTEKHVQDLAVLLEPDFEVLILRPTGPEAVSVEWARRAEEFRSFFRMPFAYSELLGFLSSLAICRIHYHHVMELHQQLLQLPKDLAVPYDFTLHDYYAICPQYMLVRSDGSYCGEPDIEGCNACLAERPAPWGLDIGAWRSLFTHLLNGAERVIAPSRDTLERVKRYIPEARYLYLPHPEPDIPSSPVIKFPSPDGELKVLVLGLLSRAKGLKLLEGCAIDAKNRKLPLFFEVIGSALEQTAQEPAIPLTFSGPYRDDDLAQLIARARADILFFPALWPETYSYTLSAAMRSGLPIAAPRLGAFPERLADYPAAWLLDWDSTPHAWNDLFLSLRTPAQSLDPSKEHNHGTG